MAARLRFRIYHLDQASEVTFLVVDLSNVPNDRYRRVLLLVGCDNSGEVEYDAVASGSGTLDVALNLRRMPF